MPTASERDEKMEALLKRVEEGTKAVFESDNYKRFLSTMAKFHSYSINNLILILFQKPESTMVAGYRAWQTKFRRNVKKGEKGIQIIGYAPKTIYKRVQKQDELGIPVYDEQGQPVTEMVRKQIPAFMPMYVFDISQTEGEPLPTLMDELTGEVDRFEVIKDVLIEISPVPVKFEAFPGGAKGKTSYMRQGNEYIPLDITVQPDMSQAQQIKTLVHEIAHAFMHSGERNTTELNNSHIRETEAESVAFVVCEHLGLDTSEYSFPYLAGWSTGKALPELKGSLERIGSQAQEIIQKLEAGIDRAIEQAKKMIQTVQPQEAAYRLDHGGYLFIQLCDVGYDYTIYNNKTAVIDGGQLEGTDQSIETACREVCALHGMSLDALQEIEPEEWKARLELAEQERQSESQQRVKTSAFEDMLAGAAAKADLANRQRNADIAALVKEADTRRRE